TLDRVDLLNKEGDCRIVEYKGRKGIYDELEVLFYANLLSNELPFYDDNQLIRKVIEIAVYYYKIGEFWRKKIKKSDLSEFEQFLISVREEMMKPNWVKKDGCSPMNTHCIYRDICELLLM
ncbi:MAG: PD-(D/E)XK nuclease family protein, partial [Asgard group archaeon]|nr:PD-(D/E)XK nuclease family protein [Asgard group archaeon]